MNGRSKVQTFIYVRSMCQLKLELCQNIHPEAYPESQCPTTDTHFCSKYVSLAGCFTVDAYYLYVVCTKLRFPPRLLIQERDNPVQALLFRCLLESIISRETDQIHHCWIGALRRAVGEEVSTQGSLPLSDCLIQFTGSCSVCSLLGRLKGSPGAVKRYRTLIFLFFFFWKSIEIVHRLVS